MYPFRRVVVLGSILILSTALSVARGEDEKPSDAAKAPPAPTAVEKALAEKTKIDFKDVPLSKAVDVLAKQHRIPIVLDRDTIEQTGMKCNYPVTAAYSGITLRSALNFLTRNLGVSWTTKDDRLVITTEEAAEKIFSTKVYPVDDIVAGQDKHGKPLDGSKSLVKCVTDVLSLDCERKIAGASIKIIDVDGRRALSVTHNRWVHEDMAELLHSMRAAIGKQKVADNKSAAQKKIEAALKKPVAIEMTDTPLEDVVKYLSDLLKIEIQLDRRAMANLGIYTNTPITINIKGVSLESALSMMLRDVGLVHVVQDEVLLVTTPEEVEMESSFFVETYNVADIAPAQDDQEKLSRFQTSLMDALWIHMTHNLGCSDPEVGTAAWFVNGDVHFFIVRSNSYFQNDIAWLLKEIRQIGLSRNAAGSPKQTATVLPGEEAIQKALARKVSLNFDKKPLCDVVDELKSQLKIEIQFDHRALADLVIDTTTPVSFKASDVTFRDALLGMLKPLDLWWTIRDEVLLITTREVGGWFAVTKVYRVDNLPDALLPLEVKFDDFNSRFLVSTDKVRVLVAVEPYYIQEKIAEWLAVARDPHKRHLLKEMGINKPPVSTNVKTLKHTIITPHLKQEIPKDTNVLWCNTFQLAWNELCELAGGPVKMEEPPEMVEILNRKEASKDDLDEASYVAMAGFPDDVYKKIQKQLREKFKGRANPPLFKELPNYDLDWVAYAYLDKQLPFQWRFERFDDRLRFAGKRVDSFGIGQMAYITHTGDKLAEQVAVLDFKGPDDFIIELKTKAKDDRLLLAKITPGKTLEDTIAAVEERIDPDNEKLTSREQLLMLIRPTKMEDSTDLVVPLLHFDLLREYDELYEKSLVTKNPLLNDRPVEYAAQSIRFRLDESGAVVKSEDVLRAGGMADEKKDLIFDKPFLVLLKRRGAARPYFALWVGNAELMVESSYP